MLGYISASGRAMIGGQQNQSHIKGRQYACALVRKPSFAWLPLSSKSNVHMCERLHCSTSVTSFLCFAPGTTLTSPAVPSPPPPPGYYKPRLTVQIAHSADLSLANCFAIFVTSPIQVAHDTIALRFVSSGQALSDHTMAVVSSLRHTSVLAARITSIASSHGLGHIQSLAVYSTQAEAGEC
jgi:hypothetical protein